MVLTCEMCGASLDVNKAINDVVTCEYCDSATNIHGIVRLNMSSDDRAAALMKRGFVFIEFQVWDKAKYVLDKAVNYDPENAKAYLGLLMVDTKSAKEEELSLHNMELATYKSYQKALEFADAELKARLESYNEKTIEIQRQEQKKKEKQQREIERLRQEREARERQAREERERAARKRMKRNIIAVASVLLIIGVLTTVGLRARETRLENERIAVELAIENVENLTDLTFILELVRQDVAQDAIDTRGLVAVGGRPGAYRAEPDLAESAGFAEIRFREGRVDLDQVTRFAGVSLGGGANQIVTHLQERYGIEAEVFEHDRVRTAESIREEVAAWAAEHVIDPENPMTFIMPKTLTAENPCPKIIEIRFVKNDIPVQIKMTRTYYDWGTVCRETGEGSRRGTGGGGMLWDNRTNWTITVGE